jgi:uncharacterized protein YndB with AHSA1/START domain
MRTLDDARRILSAANIARSPADVFSYVTTPRNWPHWHPSSLAVSGEVDHPLALGEECIEDYVVAGRRGSCVWRVVERVEPQRWTIVSVDASGGGSATIAYTLSPAGDGTRFLRSMTYAMPNRWYGLLDALFIRKRIVAESDEAVRRLKGVLEAARA